MTAAPWSVISDVSVGVLCVVLALEVMTLKALLQEVSWLTRLIGKPSSQADPMQQSMGKKLPSFRLRAIGSDEFITDEEIRGTYSVVLFINDSDFIDGDDPAFRSLIMGHLTHAEERFYVICEGAHAAAHWGESGATLLAWSSGRIKMFVDERSELRQALDISVTPSSVIFDEGGVVKRVGHPVARGGLRGFQQHA